MLGPQNQSASPSQCFPAPPTHTYQGQGRNPRPRARDGAASAEGEHQVQVTHAAALLRCTPVPPGTSQKAVGPFPSLAGWQPGH